MRKLVGVIVTFGVMSLGTAGYADDTPEHAAAIPEAGTESSGAAAAATDNDAAADGAAAGSEEQKFSDAEVALWMGDQLKSIHKPVKLKYEFRKGGSLEEGFTDAIELDITDVHADGKKNAVVNFFTGARNHFVPPFENIDGNPLLAVYLQGDVIEMNRLTEGNWRYFHRLIKHALAERAEVKETSIEFDGKTVPAKQIRISPYTEDPRADQNDAYRKIKEKSYTFTVSENVPGYLYEVRTFVAPPKNAADQSIPVLEESMRLVAVEDKK